MITRACVLYLQMLRVYPCISGYTRVYCWTFRCTALYIAIREIGGSSEKWSADTGVESDREAYEVEVISRYRVESDREAYEVSGECCAGDGSQSVDTQETIATR